MPEMPLSLPARLQSPPSVALVIMRMVRWVSSLVSGCCDLAPKRHQLQLGHVSFVMDLVRLVLSGTLPLGFGDTS